MSSDIPGTRPDVGRALAWSFAAFRRNPVPYISLAAVVAEWRAAYVDGSTVVKS